jgi:hypothetical protein
MNRERLLLECECGYLPHVIKLQKFDGEVELYVDLIIDPAPGFWSRVFQALKLIFKRQPILCETILDQTSQDRLREFLT